MLSSTCLDIDTIRCTLYGHHPGVKVRMGLPTDQLQGREHASKALLVLLLLAGDIHLNPGPTTSEQQQANSVVQVRPDTGGVAQTPPMHTPEPRRAAQWSEQLLVQSQELPEQQRHAEECSASVL